MNGRLDPSSLGIPISDDSGTLGGLDEAGDDIGDDAGDEDPDEPEEDFDDPDDDELLSELDDFTDPALSAMLLSAR